MELLCESVTTTFPSAIPILCFNINIFKKAASFYSQGKTLFKPKPISFLFWKNVGKIFLWDQSEQFFFNFSVQLPNQKSTICNYWKNPKGGWSFESVGCSKGLQQEKSKKASRGRTAADWEWAAVTGCYYFSLELQTIIPILKIG